MKKGKLKKQSKNKIPVLKRKLWKVFSLYVKKRDKNICFTCGGYCEGKNAHSGHFIPKSVGGITLYFNENNVHCQCMNCNINLVGNQYIYGEKLGKEMVTELYRLKQITAKWDEKIYLNGILYFECKLKQYD